MTIELTKEQIEKKKVDLEKLENQLEVAKLQVKQFEKNIKSELPLREAIVELDDLKKEIKRQEHNAKVFRIQIKTGRLQTI